MSTIKAILDSVPEELQKEMLAELKEKYEPKPKEGDRLTDEQITEIVNNYFKR